MIEYKIISSGSKGNAVIINKHYLIDCGVSMKALRPYLGQLTVVFLTHWHGDHFKASTIKALAEERPSLRFACCRWMATWLMLQGVSSWNIDVLASDKMYSYPYMRVSAFEVTHDIPNCGYKMFFDSEDPLEDTSGSLFYATDCANLNGIEAKGYDLYMVEANHKAAEIDEKIAEKKANGEFAYEVRARAMHLSEEDALDFIYRNAGPNSNYIFMHQHEEKEVNDGSI